MQINTGPLQNTDLVNKRELHHIVIETDMTEGEGEGDGDMIHYEGVDAQAAQAAYITAMLSAVSTSQNMVELTWAISDLNDDDLGEITITTSVQHNTNDKP